MKIRTFRLLLTLTTLALATHPAGASEPCPASLPSAPQRVYGNTTEVEALALTGTTLWAATRGGLERYDTRSLERTGYYSTLEGLPSLFVKSVAIGPDASPIVESGEQSCTLNQKAQRFSCSMKSGLPPRSQVPPRFDPEMLEGVRVTSRVEHAGESRFYGTAGRGVWRWHEKRWQRLTPVRQLCSNHVVAMTEFGQRSWFATFDRGLCRLEHEEFVEAAISASFLNDVLGTDKGLFVASSEGLFRSHDGVHFERELRITERNMNDLAYDPKRQLLYATATNSLWKLPLGDSKHHVRAYYQPGGSRSLQGVDVGPDGEVWVASEDRGVMRKSGNKDFIVYDRLAGLPSSWAIDVLATGSKSALVASLDQGVMSLRATGSPRPMPTPDAWMLFLGRDSSTPDGIFLGTQGGAVLMRAQGQSQSFEGLPDPRVHAIARLTSGLWVATEGGLARY